MKKFLSVGTVFILSIQLLCGFSIGTQGEDSGNNIIYVGNEEMAAIALEKLPMDVVSVETFDGVEYSEKTNFITTDEMLNGDYKHWFNSVFEENNRIFVLGDISEEDMREYFDLPTKNSAYQEKANSTSDDADANFYAKYGESVEIVNVAEFPVLGRMIYQNEEGTNVTTVYVEDLNDMALVANTIDYCFSYDYLRLSSEAAKARDFNNSWSNVDVNTNTYSHERATVTTSIGIDKNDGNPNSDGEYLFYVPYRVDVDVNVPYVTHNVSLDVAGNIASSVYEYGPKDISCDANASVSFQLPQAISVSFTPGEKVAITKTDGGFDSNNFTVEYQPKNFLGIDSYTANRMQCEAHIEGYQTGSYFQAYGAFEIETYRAQQPSGGHQGLLNL